MDRLQGGPYYELSFLIRNKAYKEDLLKDILSKLKRKTKFKILNSEEELREKIKFFVEGEKYDEEIFRSFDINTQIEIAGRRISRLFIAELSDELLKINFWFYGSQYDVTEWNQLGLKEIDKPAFREYFWVAKKLLNPILGTIAYEEDCSELFDTTHKWPNDYFRVENLRLETIKKRISRNKNEFEYCWVNGSELGLNENIEIEIQIEIAIK